MAYFFLLFLFLIQTTQATTECEVSDLFAQVKRDKTVYQSRGIAPAVLVVEQLVDQLKTEADVQKAGQRVAALRLLIAKGAGVGDLKSRKANDTERAILINAITYIETAAALVDGHFSFHFCEREKGLWSGERPIPGTYRDENARTLEAMAADGRLSLEQQKHLTSVYAFARVTQLRIENSTTTDLPVYIRRTINSRHLPSFMREIYKREMMPLPRFKAEIDAQLSPWSLINLGTPALKLIKTRATEKNADSRHTLVTETLKIDVEEYNEEFKQLMNVLKETRETKEEMQLYAVPPNHGCWWYATHSIYGYEQPCDLLDLMIDNLADEPEFVHNFVNWCIKTFWISSDMTDGGRLQKQTQTFLLKKAQTEEEKTEIRRIFNAPNVQEEWEKSKFVQWCTDINFIKDILEYYRTYSVNLSNARNIRNLADLSLFLSHQRDCITWKKKEGEGNKLFGKVEQTQGEFRHQYHSKNHANVLVPKLTTPQTLVDWVKATQRERVTGTTLTDSYISSWT